MNERIKLIRKALGLTLAEFGEKLSLTYGAISIWEHGRNGVPESARKQICAVFNVSREWLETGEGEMFVASRTPEELDFEAFKRVARRFVEALPAEAREAAVEVAREIAALSESEGAEKKSAKRKERGRSAPY